MVSRGCPKALVDSERILTQLRTDGYEIVPTYDDAELVIVNTCGFIVGFPGETDEDFEQLLSFLESAQLDRVGCFKYSPVAGARANALPDPVPEDVKQERFERFMALQSKISAGRLASRIGTEQEVLIDAVDENIAVSRSRLEAPEIDGVIHIDDPRGLRPGDLVRVRIEDADEHDLWATLPGRP